VFTPSRRRRLAPFVVLVLVALALPAFSGTASAQSPGLVGNALDDSVEGNQFAPNAVVDITVNGTLFDNIVMTDGSGGFFAPYDILGIGLVVGDVIVASDGTTTKDVTLAGPISIDVDEIGLTASGVAPASGMLNVIVGGDACQASSPFFLDGSGTWSVDLSIQCPGGLGALEFAEVILEDGDGDGTLARPVEKCSGQVFTVNIARGEAPTDGADVIIGTEEADTIDALGGNDVVCGLGGDDVINGGDGKDTLQGDAGDDTLDGGDGNDKLVGGDGNDTLLGQGGRDVIQGGDGNDIAEGGKKNDRISGNGGRDTLNGGNGKDRIDGQSGPDTIIGGGGNDRLIGGGGVDTINGKVGNDFCIEGETVLLCEFDFIP